MADPSQPDDRTEAATPRRLQRAREEGHVPVSRELVTLAGLVAATLTLVYAAPSITRDLASRLSVFLAKAHTVHLEDGTAFRLAGMAWLHAAGPFVLATLLAGAAAVVVQTGFLFNPHALQPDISRVNPRAGLKRIFGPDSLIEAGKSLIKIAVLSIMTWQVLRSDLPALLLAPYDEAGPLLARTIGPVLHVLFAVLVAQTAIAALDFFWVVLRHNRGLRMSRHDIQEEQRETEGDPRVKARLRQLRMVRARRRMLAAVPKATVVITNPTHYAVALSYDRAKHAAPRVVAKGVDSLAARIREVAEANHVPLVANPPLAHALYRVELDTDIPAEHYQAVAEIIAYLWRLDGRLRGAA
jgi:flagellar biosynthetic protein FlhB